MQVCGSKGLAAMLAVKKAADVNMRNPLHTDNKTCQHGILALKPRAEVTRSPEQGFQWHRQKADILQQISKKWKGYNLKEFPTWTPCASSSSGTSASSTISWTQHTQWDLRLVSRCPLCSPGFNPARDGDMDRLPLLAPGISSAGIRNICTFFEMNISAKYRRGLWM